jgi:hypothetical protein
MTGTDKYIAVTFCFLLCAVATIAQPQNESQRGAYSSQQVRQARENAATNRHYESIKPASSNTAKISNTSNSGTYSPYQPYKYSEKARQQYLENQRLERQAALQKQKAAQQQLFRDRKQEFTLAMFNKGITKNKEHYTSIITLATTYNLPDTFYYRMFGKSEQEFEQKIMANDYQLNFYFPDKARMMRPTSASYYTNYVAVQNAAVNKPSIPEHKKDTLQKKTTVLDGLRLKDQSDKTPVDNKGIYNKLLMKPGKDTLQQNKNSIYKSLQLQ